MMRYGFLFTGTRCFGDIANIELWASDTQVRLKTCDGDVLLDEDESRLIRRWADLSLQAAIADFQADVIVARCDFQDSIKRARKLNRAGSGRKRQKAPVTLSAD